MFKYNKTVVDLSTIDISIIIFSIIENSTCSFNLQYHKSSYSGNKRPVFRERVRWNPVKRDDKGNG